MDISFQCLFKPFPFPVSYSISGEIICYTESGVTMCVNGDNPLLLQTDICTHVNRNPMKKDDIAVHTEFM